MNCAGVRKFLYAFADGQLSVKANCQVLDHLKMCAACSRIVDDHQAQRAAVRRNLEQIEVPGTLRDQVRQAIKTGKPAAAPRPLKLFFSVRTLAAAACVGVVTVAVWKVAIPADPTPAPDGTGIVRVQFSNDAVSMAVTKHDSCCQVAEDHHSSGLPRALSEVAVAIADRYDNVLRILAPDLSDHGFRFESANFCGVRNGRPCKDGLHPEGEIERDLELHGGHLLYVGKQHEVPTRLSVFSVPRWDRLERCGGAPPLVAGLRRYVVERGHDPDVAVAVWHEDATSFVCCGDIESDALAEIAADVRLALHRPEARQIFAMLWSGGR